MCMNTYIYIYRERERYGYIKRGGGRLDHTGGRRLEAPETASWRAGGLAMDALRQR